MSDTIAGLGRACVSQEPRLQDTSQEVQPLAAVIIWVSHLCQQSPGTSMAAQISRFYQAICKRSQYLLWRSPIDLKGPPKPCATCCCRGCPALSAPCGPRPFHASLLHLWAQGRRHHSTRRNKAGLSNPVAQTRTALHGARTVLWWTAALGKNSSSSLPFHLLGCLSTCPPVTPFLFLWSLSLSH